MSFSKKEIGTMLDDYIEDRGMVKDLIIYGSKITYNEDNLIIMLGITYEIFKNERGQLKIHNRIYEQWKLNQRI